MWHADPDDLGAVPLADGRRRGPPVRRWPRPRVSALLHNPTHVSGQERVNALGGQRGAILDVVAVVDNTVSPLRVLPVDGGKTPQLYVPSFDITNLDNQAEDR